MSGPRDSTATTWCQTPFSLRRSTRQKDRATKVCAANDNSSAALSHQVVVACDLLATLLHPRAPPMRSLIVLIGLISVSSPALASSIVVPNNRAATVGNDTGSIGPGLEPDVRSQQLFGSGQFLSVVSGPILIDQFAFRVAAGTGPFNATLANLDVYISTSQYFPNLGGGAALLMSTTFSTNVGPDNTLVYHGPVTLVSPGCAGPAPCPFDLTVNLTTPFLYNPLQGRLLVDFFVRGPNGIIASFFDADNYGSGFGSIATVTGAFAATTGDLGHGGDITQFRYTAVPEPATMTLLLTGLGVAARLRRRVKS